LLEDQKRNRLAEIDGRSVERAKQIAGVKLRHTRADTRQIGRCNDRRGF
jgi:hypothetical protein